MLTLTNSGTNPAQSGIAFTESLPASLRWTSAAPTITFGAGCAGSSVVTQGTPDTVAFSAVTMANATASCTITIVGVTNRAGQVNASCAGNPAAFTNAAANITGTTNVTNAVTGQCVVVNTVAPTLTKAWSTATINDGATTNLVLTLTNSGTNPAQSGIAFTESLPASLRWTSAAPTITFGAGCAGSSVVTQGTPDTVAFSAVTMANATASCTITIAGVTNRAGQVNASCAGNPAAFTNAAANITGTTNVTNAVTGQCVVVNTVAPTLTKAWSTATINDGATTNLVLTLTNSGTNPAQSGIAFTESLPASLRWTSAAPTITFGAGCAGSSVVTQGTPDTVAFSAVTMANATASCTITIAGRDQPRRSGQRLLCGQPGRVHQRGGQHHRHDQRDQRGDGPVRGGQHGRTDPDQGLEHGHHQ